MYAMIKGILARRGAPDLGGVRAPLTPLQPEDLPIAEETAAWIDALIKQFC
jgi:dihydrodipicolinate synthase/N-acetylneuraminate lyase